MSLPRLRFLNGEGLYGNASLFGKVRKELPLVKLSLSDQRSTAEDAQRQGRPMREGVNLVKINLQPPLAPKTIQHTKLG